MLEWRGVVVVSCGVFCGGVWGLSGSGLWSVGVWFAVWFVVCFVVVLGLLLLVCVSGVWPGFFWGCAVVCLVVCLGFVFAGVGSVVV